MFPETFVGYRVAMYPLYDVKRSTSYPGIDSRAKEARTTENYTTSPHKHRNNEYAKTSLQ
jgi:hypothetical protein